MKLSFHINGRAGAFVVCLAGLQACAAALWLNGFFDGRAVALQTSPQAKAVLVIHGGCGVVSRAEMTPAREQQYRMALTNALRAGQQVLNQSNDAVAAVVAAVRSMEDSGIFNAGRGAVYNHEGRHQLDASVMDGKNLKAGAVGAVSTVKNPILAAKAVMECSPHVFMIGDGADDFARSVGLDIVPNSYFDDAERLKDLQEFLKEEAEQGHEQARLRADCPDRRMSTVGAVARNKQGELAAATSTGGLTGKRWGRVGDSPVIGAGTYADSKTCAVSCTGDGELFIRGAVAHDVHARVKYAHQKLAAAAHDVIADAVSSTPGGEGGLIALQSDGTFCMEFNTPGMYRGWLDEQGAVHVEIY